MKIHLVFALLLLPALAQAALPSKGQTSDSLTRVTDISDVANFYASASNAIPKNNGRQVWDFTGFDSSKIYPTNRGGSLMLARNSNGYFGVYALPSFAFLGTLPLSRDNSMSEGNNPRWADGDNIIFTHGAHAKKQVWNRPETAVVVGTAPAGYGFINIRGDGDMDDLGRFYPVMVASVFDSNGRPSNARSTVLDLATGRLGAWIDAYPDGIDVSPDGTALAWMDGEGTAAFEPNRLYRIVDLIGNVVKPINVDSVITNGVKSLGHYGWAKQADRSTVLVAQDNRSDYYTAFDLSTGKVAKLILNAAALSYPDIHFGRSGPPGYIVTSRYYASTSIDLLELATGAMTRLGSTHCRTTGKESEGAVCVDREGRWGYFGSNWEGRLGHLEIFRVPIPAMVQAAPSPTPTPKPTATPTPAPIPVLTRILIAPSKTTRTVEIRYW